MELLLFYIDCNQGKDGGQNDVERTGAVTKWQRPDYVPIGCMQ